jgi:hypothetical protein
LPTLVEGRSRLGALAGALASERALWGALLAAAYVASRLYAAARFPIFIDEAIHVDWARATADSYPAPDAGFDGKWLSVKLFALATRPAAPFDELVAARLLVVGLGLTAALACHLVGRDLFSRRAGALAAALYVALPFSVIYTSLAMTDGVQLAFGAWAVFLAVRLARGGRWPYAALLPLALAAAVLAKFSGLVLVALPAAAVLLLAPEGRRAAAALRALPALLTPVALFAIFYSYDLLQIVKTKAAENSAGAGGRLWANLASAGGWLWGLLTPGVALPAAAAFAWLVLARGRRRAGLFVLTLFGLAVLPFAAVSQTWYPRYILAAVLPVALAVGRLLDLAAGFAGRRLRGRPALAAAALPLLVVGVLSWPALRSAEVLFALPDAALPEAERFQFVTGWPSGYGVAELTEFLREQAAATPGGVTVARTYWADHPLQSLNIYLTPSPSLSLFTLADEDEPSALSLRWQSARRRTLLVLTTDHGVPQRLRKAGAPLLKCARPLWSYTRPGGTTGFAVYELSCGPAPAAR